SACRGELRFLMRSTARVAAIAHRFKRLIDLAERGLSHGSVPPPLGEEHHCDACIAKTRRPIERRALAGPFLQGLTVGGDGLFKLRSPALARSEGVERIAQIVLGRGPAERRTLAGVFLQRVAIGNDRLFEFCRPALARSESVKRIAQTDLGAGPRERHALASTRCWTGPSP